MRSTTFDNSSYIYRRLLVIFMSIVLLAFSFFSGACAKKPTNIPKNKVRKNNPKVKIQIKNKYSHGEVAATINDNKIFTANVEHEYKSYVNQLKSNKQPAPDKKSENNIKKMILDRLISEELILQTASKEGVVVYKKEFERDLNIIKNKAGFKNALNSMGWTIEDLKYNKYKQMIKDKLKKKISKNNDYEKYINDFRKTSKIKILIDY